MDECAICFSDFEDSKGEEVLIKIQCADTNCEGAICEVCLPDLIAFVHKQKQLPLCTTPGCEAHYPLKSLRKALTRNQLREYGQTLLDYFLGLYEKDLTFVIRKNVIVRQLREDRLKYLEEKFPLGLQIVARIALSHKLKQTKEQRDKLERALKKGRRACLRTGCKGKLDDDLKCSRCRTQFCEQCEQKLGGTHICKEEDVSTVQLLKAEVKCPECFMPINKTAGCNHMVCSNCHTKFDYGTGKKFNHNDNAGANSNSHLTNIGMLEVYKEYINSHKRSTRIRRLIEEIEFFGQKPASDTAIRKLLKDHLKVVDRVEIEKQEKETEEESGEGEYDIEESRRLTDHKLIPLFEDFSNDTLDYRDYVEDLDYIEICLRKQKISVNTLKDIHYEWVSDRAD